MRRFINWFSASASGEVFLGQAVSEIVRQLPAWGAEDWTESSPARAAGYLRARLRRPVHDYLDQLERAEPGRVARRRNVLFLAIREGVVAQLMQASQKRVVSAHDEGPPTARKAA